MKTWIIAVSLGIVLSTAGTSGAFAQAGSTGGTVGKTDKSTSGGGEEAVEPRKPSTNEPRQRSSKRERRTATWTDTFTTGGWIGRDRSCSQGATPHPSECNSETVGQVAVCWANRKTGERNDATAWCTYKVAQINTPQDGLNPGRIYQCRGP
jgi:hypothetical protein